MRFSSFYFDLQASEGGINPAATKVKHSKAEVQIPAAEPASDTRLSFTVGKEVRQITMSDAICRKVKLIH